jgi:hypothetical protein
MPSFDKVIVYGRLVGEIGPTGEKLKRWFFRILIGRPVQTPNPDIS